MMTPDNYLAKNVRCILPPGQRRFLEDALGDYAGIVLKEQAAKHEKEVDELKFQIVKLKNSRSPSRTRSLYSKGKVGIKPFDNQKNQG